MVVFYSIIFFLGGTIFGSFFTVIGIRLPQKENFISDKSRCRHCQKKLRRRELIPILSYLFQKGKCPHCKKKISPIYPLTEIVSGILYVISYLVFGFSLNLIIGLVISAVFIIILVSDIKYQIIPDSVLIISGLIILVTYLISTDLTTTLYHLLDAGILFGVMFLIKILGNFMFKKESLGDGDIKLMGVMGLLLEPLMGFVGIVIASLIALPYAIMTLKSKDSHEIPFGPFLMIGCLILFFLNIKTDFIVDLITIKI